MSKKKNICYTEDISEKYLEKEDNYSKITTQKKENIKDEIIKNTSTYITSPIKKSNEVRKAAALLIGGTVDNTTYLDQRLEKLMDDCEITIKSKQVSADLALIRQEFHKQKIDIIDEIPFQLKAEKRYTVQKIKELFSVEAKLYIIFWTGHGEQGSGDWVFSSCRTLSLDELLKLWKKAALNKNISQIKPKLLVISDCCYSGGWCNSLNSYQQDGKVAAYHRVFIQASCEPHQLAYGFYNGSNFTRKFVSDIQLKDKHSLPNSSWCSIEQIPMFAAFEPESFVSADGSEVYCILEPFKLVACFPN